MKKVGGIVMALLLVFAVAAWAEEIQGKIKAVDMSERTFELEDGTKLSVAEGISMQSLKEGAAVKASYEERDGKKVVTAVEVED